MGVTQYVSVSTAEYALWNRLEGAARAIVKSSVWDTRPSNPTLVTVREILDALEKRRA